MHRPFSRRPCTVRRASDPLVRATLLVLRVLIRVTTLVGFSPKQAPSSAQLGPFPVGWTREGGSIVHSSPAHQCLVPPSLPTPSSLDLCPMSTPGPASPTPPGLNGGGGVGYEAGWLDMKGGGVWFAISAGVWGGCGMQGPGWLQGRERRVLDIKWGLIEKREVSRHEREVSGREMRGVWGEEVGWILTAQCRLPRLRMKLSLWCSLLGHRCLFRQCLVPAAAHIGRL